MNNRGELTVGSVVILAVALILGAVFAGAIADEQAKLTETRDTTNDTITAAAENQTVELDGQAVVGSVTVTNTTSDDVSDQFTVLNNQINDNGDLTAQLETDAGANEAGNSVNTTYTYEPLGYNSETSARTVATLPLLFFVLAVLGVAVLGIREWINRG